MKTNLELTQEAEGSVARLVTLIEQRYREQLLGVKVEPVQGAVLVSGCIYEDCDVYTADQVAAMVAQAMPRRLTREQVDEIFDAHQEAPHFEFRHLVADAIQDALGVKEPKP